MRPAQRSNSLLPCNTRLMQELHKELSKNIAYKNLILARAANK
jgi:hypothetical protein